MLQVKKPKIFVMPPQNGPKVQVIPKLEDLTESTAGPLPGIVVQKHGDATIVVGVDFEAADWVDKKQPITKEPKWLLSLRARYIDGDCRIPGGG